MAKGWEYQISKLCFFDSDGKNGNTGLNYRFNKRGTELDCERCHFRDRCVKPENYTRGESK